MQLCVSGGNTKMIVHGNVLPNDTSLQRTSTAAWVAAAAWPRFHVGSTFIFFLDHRH